VKTRWMVITALAATPVFAQYGQYPPGGYPPGQYPPGQNGAGPGISLPHRSKKKAAEKKKDAVPNFNQDGWIYSSTAAQLQILTDDGRLISFKLDDASKFTQGSNPATLAQATKDAFVHVEAFEDDEYFLTAATVDLRKGAAPKLTTAEASAAPATPPPPAPKPAATATTADNNTPPNPDSLGPPPDAPGRPKLHHGKPRAGDAPDPDEDMNHPPPKPAVVSSSPDGPKDGSIDFTVGDEKAEAKRKSSPYDDLIERTHQWSESFSQGLPNFVCEQLTTRYQENSRSEGFQPHDVVSAKVIYEDGKEDYKEIMVGGKRVNKGMMEVGGSTSTGEFASTLRSLFSGYVDAQFKFQESSTTGRTPVAIYNLKVLLPHSDWEIMIGGQRLHPAYSGSVWVDKESAEVRRIEIQAENVPKNFPGDTEMMTVDYEPVSLGTTKFLLPVHSENLACYRGTTICTKNTIDFRDYHKYSGESTVEFK
jgi:hypothetical protein